MTYYLKIAVSPKAEDNVRFIHNGFVLSYYDRPENVQRFEDLGSLYAAVEKLTPELRRWASWSNMNPLWPTTLPVRNDLPSWMVKTADGYNISDKD